MSRKKEQIHMPKNIEIRNDRVVEVNTTVRTISAPALARGWELAERLPRNAGYGEYWVNLDGSFYGSGRTTDLVWIVSRIQVLKMRDKPGRNVPLIPSDSALENGFTPPLTITEFRQPLPGEAHVSRRYKTGHAFARVQTCETRAESAERADGRWIVVPAAEAAPAPAPRRGLTLSADDVDALQQRLVNAGYNLSDARAILGR